MRPYNSFLHIYFAYNEATKTREVKALKLSFEKYHDFPFDPVGGFKGFQGRSYFRVPILRNITKTAPYFHNGSVKDLRDAIFIMGRHQVGVDLSEQQIDEIEEFFKSLEGKPAHLLP
ncbi:MAG: hypothetical protein FAF05_04450 [Epsilonproteobacteria bacterium]|nr:hypothetical protein [Campylobacterota bacterium]